MRPKLFALPAPISLFVTSPGPARITVTSKDLFYFDGAATLSTMVPLGTYAWTRSANFDGQYDTPPTAGQQPSADRYATTDEHPETPLSETQ